MRGKRSQERTSALGKELVERFLFPCFFSSVILILLFFPSSPSRGGESDDRKKRKGERIKLWTGCTPLTRVKVRRWGERGWKEWQLQSRRVFKTGWLKWGRERHLTDHRKREHDSMARVKRVHLLSLPQYESMHDWKKGREWFADAVLAQLWIAVKDFNWSYSFNNHG